jgi:type I restriction enzyme, R subunit
MRKEKSTVAKFGGLIDIYAIDQAVKDGAAVPGGMRGGTSSRT